METSSVRSRYAGRRSAPVRPMPGRGRRRNSRNSSLQRLITLQALICSLLFFIIIITKNVNISAANFLTEQIEFALNHNIELKSILAYADDLAADIRNSIVPGSVEKSRTDKLAVSGIAPGGEKDTSSGMDSDLAATSASITTSTSSTPQTSSTTQTSNTPQTSNTTQTSSMLANSDHSPEETVNDIVNPVEKSVLSASTDSDIVPDMSAPVDGTLATPFGEIRRGASGNEIHEGIDIHAKKQSSVKAVMDGEVIETGSSPSYADYIRMRHEYGFETIYAYCRVITVQEGDFVNRGDVIAQIGDQDISAGQHLHFEVWKDGEAVDPLEYISVAIR